MSDFKDIDNVFGNSSGDTIRMPESVANPPPKKRGRHPKDCTCAKCEERRRTGGGYKTPKEETQAGPVPPPLELDAKAIELGIRIIVGVIVARAGDHWDWYDSEFELVSNRLKEFGEYYAPEFALKHAPAIMLLSSVALVVARCKMAPKPSSNKQDRESEILEGEIVV